LGLVPSHPFEPGEHSPPHIPLDGTQTKGQVFVDTAGQAPFESHVASLICRPFEQLADRHRFAG
jgi:hypothetical protein